MPRHRPALAAIHRQPPRILEPTLLTRAPKPPILAWNQLPARVLDTLAQSVAVLDAVAVCRVAAGPDDCLFASVAVYFGAALSEAPVGDFSRGIVGGWLVRVLVCACAVGWDLGWRGFEEGVACHTHRVDGDDFNRRGLGERVTCSHIDRDNFN